MNVYLVWLRCCRAVCVRTDINGRRAVYEDIFTRLASAGIDRGSLQLAWDFTTGSRASITNRFLSMRKDGAAPCSLPHGLLLAVCAGVDE